MKLEEALDIVRSECCVPNSVFMTPKYQAFALLIEAGKFVLQLQNIPGRQKSFTLPGETKD